MRLFITAVIVLILHTYWYAQTKPKFSDYPVKRTFKGRLAKVNLTTARGAQFYRTRLREGAAQGPNFAGHYALITWGCGSPCITVALVDSKTGRVWWAPFGGLGEVHIDYRLNSRLVIVNSREVLDRESPKGPPKWMGEWPEEVFFVWTGNRFRRILPRQKREPRAHASAMDTRPRMHESTVVSVARQ